MVFKLCYLQQKSFRKWKKRNWYRLNMNHQSGGFFETFVIFSIHVSSLETWLGLKENLLPMIYRTEFNSLNITFKKYFVASSLHQLKQIWLFNHQFTSLNNSAIWKKGARSSWFQWQRLIQNTTSLNVDRCVETGSPAEWSRKGELIRMK